MFHRSSGASTRSNFKSALTCNRALLEVLAPQIFLLCYFTSSTVEFTVNYRLFGCICTVKYCETNFCLSKIQTWFAMQFKTRAQATGKCLLLHEIFASVVISRLNVTSRIEVIGLFFAIRLVERSKLKCNGVYLNCIKLSCLPFRNP